MATVGGGQGPMGPGGTAAVPRGPPMGGMGKPQARQLRQNR